MKLKICGMKYQDNILSVAELQPDYLGFIFYEKSKRNFDGEIPKISNHIKRTGVFVNASLRFILEKVKKYNLKAIQLHGDENPKFCREFLKNNVEVIKVFSVGESFNFNDLNDYKDACNYFLFDTKGKERGGNGEVFNWKILEDYPFEKPYFLSGGIGLNELEDLNKFLRSKASEYCYAIDVNSKFEMNSGLKNVEKLRVFIQKSEN